MGMTAMRRVQEQRETYYDPRGDTLKETFKKDADVWWSIFMNTISMNMSLQDFQGVLIFKGNNKWKK